MVRLARAVSFCAMLAGAATAAGAADSTHCNLSGFDRTQPPAMLSPQPDGVPIDWGSDADELAGHRGWLFWHYVHNKPDSGSLWVSWEAVHLWGSAARALPAGGTVCKISQYFFQPGKPPDIAPVVVNNTQIVYGADGRAQDASIYVPGGTTGARPAPPVPSNLLSSLTRLFTAYADPRGGTHELSVAVDSTHEGTAYTLRVRVVPDNLVIGISDLPHLLDAEQLGAMASMLRAQKVGAEPGSLPKAALADLFRSARPAADRRYLFLRGARDAAATFKSVPGQSPGAHSVLLVVLDAERQPILAATATLLLPIQAR